MGWWYFGPYVYSKNQYTDEKNKWFNFQNRSVFYSKKRSSLICFGSTTESDACAYTVYSWEPRYSHSITVSDPTKYYYRQTFYEPTFSSSSIVSVSGNNVNLSDTTNFECFLPGVRCYKDDVIADDAAGSRTYITGDVRTLTHTHKIYLPLLLIQTMELSLLPAARTIAVLIPDFLTTNQFLKALLT